MPAFRGKDLLVNFDSQDISGDGRSVSYEESADILDDTTYGDDNRTKQAGLLDGSGSFEALDQTGSWSAGWQAIAPGTSGTMIIYPEGNTSTKRTATFTAVIGSRSVDFPYDGLATLSMSFEISGAVVEGAVA
jgi:hypothetical protein